MKYYPVDIQLLCNHKMMLGMNGFKTESADGPNSIDQEVVGISGRWITDKRFDFTQCDKYQKRMKFRLLGSDNDFDNISCEEQRVSLPDRMGKKIAFLGFGGYHSYKEKIWFLTIGGEDISERLQFYHITECMDSLYNSEKGENCSMWFSAKSNICTPIKYYCTICSLPEHTIEIILPDNSDMHIAAVTIVR